ncbi:E2 ubiquitin ligase-like protein [Leishmania panamensis]|uniref:E2 ubiquitin ligase-like protein n=1 Tax=Leishmania panamensis TaxID=5679 RepID=A0A088S3E9_LEIPA|nr:E2 ubiquitin ligase-like protein [Leishmania panamensis]AIN96016.1 E2 ubiquitin ligase-like protein [Leishmania panamensis]
MNDDVVRFFSNASHYRPEVLRRIVMEIDNVCSSLCFSRKITTWGNTEQPKICLYGGLSVGFPMIPRADASVESGVASEPVIQSLVIPIQIWISHQFPIEPPFIYLACARISGNSRIPGSVNASVLKIVNNHPNVDFTGLCFCKELAEWRPSTSSLCFMVKRLGRALEKSGRCPIYIDQEICGNSLTIDGNNSGSDKKNIIDNMLPNSCLVCYRKKDTVLVPCGHFCACMSCAANLTECPVCRSKIMVRQRVFE